MFVRWIGGTFQWPAMQASTSLMVPEQHLARVAGLNQTLQGVLNIAAPPLGALLLELVPLHGIMAIDVVTAALAMVSLLFVQIPRPQRSAGETATGNRTSVWEDMHAGFRYVRGWPGLLALLGMATLLNFLINPAFALLPLLVTSQLEGEARHLGWMNSIFGVGTLLGGLTLGVWGGFGPAHHHLAHGALCDGLRDYARDRAGERLLAGAGRDGAGRLEHANRQRPDPRPV